ncbi:uncharacterized protein LOC135169798 [Diachasmimorpha longicaudata]|uniref:uncharacterized protein LOC135169798 n=1 Tax=Diachasmimorpha longicaudata TaxID=58733 RepID=UPI0030B869C4
MASATGKEIEGILRKIQAFKGQTTSVHSFLKLYKNRDPLDGKLEERITKYKEKYAEIEETIKRLEELDPDNDHHPADLKYNLESDFNLNVAEYESQVATAKNDRSNISEASSEENKIKMRKVKLPDAKPPKFNGEFENWLCFKAEFEALIHNREDISKVDKMSYLRSSLTGAAYEKIKMMSISTDNYDRAWNLLIDTYSDVRILIGRHLKLLLALPAQDKETASGISQLVDTTN